MSILGKLDFEIGFVGRDVDQFEKYQRLCKKVGVTPSQQSIFVNTETQTLHLIGENSGRYSYPISTAKNGVGQLENTGQTPLGLHSVGEKIGCGALPFAIFKSRMPTGEIAVAKKDEDAIVGRILWLRGLQEGFNKGCDEQGKVVDTYNRYIYIHGTNDIDNIGMPVSAGCIRMTPSHVIDLFNKIPEGTLVHIY